MSEQQQVHRRTEEIAHEPMETIQQVALSQMQEEIFDDDMNIDISDLVEESMDVAKVFKQKGGQ